MLIGAGKMGELAARHLLAQRRRQPDRHQPHLRARRRAGARVPRHAGAVRAVSEVPADGRHRHRLDRRRRATCSPRRMVHEALRERKGRPMFCIDLSVPRNFDPRINEHRQRLPLRHRRPRRGRRGEPRRARAARRRRPRRIVSEEVESFWRWLGHLEVVPTIVALRDKIEAIRRGELQKTLNALKDLGAARARGARRDDRRRSSTRSCTRRSPA